MQMFVQNNLNILRLFFVIAHLTGSAAIAGYCAIRFCAIFAVYRMLRLWPEVLIWFWSSFFRQ